jgi:hypothetical protein
MEPKLPIVPMDQKKSTMVSLNHIFGSISGWLTTDLGFGRQVGGGRGGIGNIVPPDQIAPPPAQMEPSLEVETARDRVRGFAQ